MAPALDEDPQHEALLIKRDLNFGQRVPTFDVYGVPAGEDS